jgi:AcrR family transcriptional regulator
MTASLSLMGAIDLPHLVRRLQYNVRDTKGSEMSQVENVSATERVRLSRERVLRGAVAVADAGGIGSLTIRSLAQHLGVKPMSLYYYVAGKDEILDGIVDLVFGEIELPSLNGDWRSEMVRRANSARRALRRHSWAIGLMESRKNPAQRHYDTTTPSSAPCEQPASR